MNALAVEIAAREGARIVWMPTVDFGGDRERSRSRGTRCRNGLGCSISFASSGPASSRWR